jgi:rubrerythrin
MELERLLARCRAFEGRAAAVYRTFAARNRNDPEVCAMWTALARDEERHEQALARAASWIDTADGWHVNLDGWDEALDEIETRLSDAERPDRCGTLDQQLVAALSLERTEIDAIYERLLTLTRGRGDRTVEVAGHHERLLDVADRCGTDPAVALEVALLRARTALRAREHDAG